MASPNRMSKSLLKPIDTGGTMIPYLDYRIMQHEACIVEHFDDADANMGRVAQALSDRQFGVAHDFARKAQHKLNVLLAMSKAHKELKWVHQHPKFNGKE